MKKFWVVDRHTSNFTLVSSAYANEGYNWAPGLLERVQFGFVTVQDNGQYQAAIPVMPTEESDMTALGEFATLAEAMEAVEDMQGWAVPV